jgi:mannosyltransferase OCH1-like enzyme
LANESFVTFIKIEMIIIWTLALITSMMVGLIVLSILRKVPGKDMVGSYPRLYAQPVIESNMQVLGVIAEPTGCLNVDIGTQINSEGVWGVARRSETHRQPRTVIKVQYIEVVTRKKSCMTIKDWDVNDEYKEIIFLPRSKQYKICATNQTYIENIPWRIIQANDSCVIDESMHRARKSFLYRNPRLKSTFYHNRSMRDFLKNNYKNDVCDAVDRTLSLRKMTSLFSLCELYVNGGMYTDGSHDCIKPLGHLLNDVDVVVVRDTPSRDLSRICDSFIASKPSLRFLRQVISDTVNGMHCLGKSLNRYAGRGITDGHQLGLSTYGDITVRVLDRCQLKVYDTLNDLRDVLMVRKEPGENDECDLIRVSKVTTPVYQVPAKIDVEENHIPRVCYQTSETNYLNFQTRHLISANITNSLSSKWQYIIADDRMRISDILNISEHTSDPDLIRAFELVDCNMARAHFWALCILVNRGGLYIDLTNSLQIDIIKSGMEGLVTVNTVLNTVTKDLWASKKNHPFFERVLDVAKISILDNGENDSMKWFRDALQSFTQDYEALSTLTFVPVNNIK